MSQVDYEVAGREAHRYELGDGEFVRVEIYDGYFSIGWSTSLPIAAVLELVEPLLRIVDGEVVVFDKRTKAHEKRDVDDVLALLPSDDDFSFARLELSDVTLVWEQAREQDRHGPTTLGELAVLARLFDESTFVRMLRETATPRVAHHARDLIGRISYVAEYVRPGRLGPTSGDSSA